jgi:hypothetical protein
MRHCLELPANQLSYLIVVKRGQVGEASEESVLFPAGGFVLLRER